MMVADDHSIVRNGV